LNGLGELRGSSFVELALDVGNATSAELYLGFFNSASGCCSDQYWEDLEIIFTAEGEILLQESFTDAISARAFFDDAVFNFDNVLITDGVLDIGLEFNFVNADMHADFVVGANVVPIPGAVWLMLSGLGLLGWRGKVSHSRKT
jgi:hypothetical protein